MTNHNSLKPLHYAILVAMTAHEHHTIFDIEDATKISYYRLTGHLMFLENHGYIEYDGNPCDTCGRRAFTRWLTLKGQLAVEDHYGGMTDNSRATVLNNWYNTLKNTRRVRASIIMLVTIAATYLLFRHWISVSDLVYYSTITGIAGIYIGQWWKIGHRLKQKST